MHRVRAPADLVEELVRRDEARQELMRQRPGLEAVANRLVRGGPHLVRPPRAQKLLASEGETEMRAEELVRRTKEDVDTERADVDRSVRSEVDGVGPRECSCFVRERDDSRRVGHRAERVRGERKGDDAGARGQLPLEVGEVEARVFVVFDEADANIEVVGELQPRGDVPVMVETGYEDLVARG